MAGMKAYEISNHAREGYESQHNLTYWNMKDYTGIGPGAHGRLTTSGKRISTEAARRPADYMDAEAPKTETLNELDIARETLAMGLRPTSGIQIDRLPDINQTALDELQNAGMVEVADGRLSTTSAGRLLTDAIAAKLSP